MTFYTIVHNDSLSRYFKNPFHMSVPESTFNYVLPQDFLTHVVVGRAAHALNNTVSQFSTHSATKEAAAGLPVAAAFGFIPGINPGPNDLRISLNGSKKYFVDRTTPLILSYVKDDKYYYPLVVSTLLDITSAYKSQGRLK